MSDVFGDVERFHVACGFETLDKPGFPHYTMRTMWWTLLDEEMGELSNADDDLDIVEFADAIADMMYILIGMARVHGIDSTRMRRVWDEVQRSNMAKVGEDGKVHRREDGKILKPADWTPPDVAGALK